MKKKILLIVTSLVVILLAAAIVLPFLFKDEIIAMVKTEANNNLNATVDFGDVGLSLFENFPDFTLTVEQITVKGQGQFEGVMLTSMEELKLSLDLMSVINGSKIQINTIGLVKPTIHIILLPDGTANYDITKPTDEVAEEEAVEEESGFAVGIQEYYITHAEVIYDDREGGMYAALSNFTHRGSGDFTQDDFLLKTTTTADQVTYKMDGIAYLSRTKLDMKFNVMMNLPTMKFTFDENYVQLNALKLGFDGWLAMPEEEGDPMDMDFSFKTNETTFKSILSLVPAVFLTDFDDVETAGNLELHGMAKGRLVGEQYPAFDITLKVDEARFKYPDLPKSAENIAVDLRMTNSGGSDDNTVIDLKKFHVELGGNPIDMSLYMKTPISDPYLKSSINMNLDLNTLGDVIPLEEGQSVSGKVFSDLHLEGNQSALDQGRYQDFDASGQLVLTGIDYKDPEIGYATMIEVCSLSFSPSYAELSDFRMKVGKSNISLVGRMDNIVSWYVADEPLSGRFNLSSTYLDLNEFMSDDETAAAGEVEVEEESSGVVEVPGGFDFVLNTAINTLVYENLNITNLSGSLVLRDRVANMERIAMNLLDGSLVLSGSYGTVNPARPTFDFVMDVVTWDIPKTYEYLEMAQTMAPVMKYASGNFSTSMSMTGLMDEQMEPLMNTLNGKGKLVTHNAMVKSPDAFVKAADAIKFEGMKSMVMDNVNVKFKFKDGRMEVEPVNYVIGKEVPAVFSGSHGFDGTQDYVLNLDIPTKLMGGAASQVVGGLLSKANAATGMNATVPDRVLVDLLITGTADETKVTPRMAGTAGGSTTEGLKDQAMDELNAKKDEAEAKARAEVDKAKAEAEAKAKAELDKAKSSAEAAAQKANADAKAKADAAKKKAEADLKAKEAEAKKKAEEEKKKAEAAAKKKAEEEAKKKAQGLLKR